MRESDGAECGNDGFPPRADAVCAVRVRGIGDEPPAEGKVPLKHVRGGDEISRAARGRVDFQNFIARNDPAQNVVEEVRIVRIAHGAVGVGGIPRNVAEVRHNVVTVGRVQTLAHAQKIGAVGGLLRLADEVFRKPRVMPVHRDGSAIRRKASADDVYRGGFAGAVYAQKSKQLAFFHPETQIIHGFYLAERLAQVFDFNDIFHIVHLQT